MWGRRNPCALLVGMQIGATAVESSMELPPKNKKMELRYDPVIPLVGLYSKKPETLIRKNICTLMFIAGLFTIAKLWNQPQCLLVDEWIKQLSDIYTMYYSAVKKQGNLTFYNSMDGLGEHYAK